MPLTILRDPRWGNADVFVRVYQCLTDRFEDADIRTMSFGLGSALISFQKMEFEFQRVYVDRMRLVGDGMHLETKTDTVLVPIDYYTVIVAPVTPSDPAGAREAMESAEGILIAYWGRHLLSRLKAEFVSLADGRTSTYSDTHESPANWPIPVVSQESIRAFRDGLKLAPPHSSQRARLDLAARRFALARDLAGADAVIAYWTALECLTPSGMNDVAGIRKLAQAAYEVEPGVESRLLCIGPLHGLRSKIVHEGLLPPIPGFLIQHMRALWTDLFWYVAQGTRASLPDEADASALHALIRQALSAAK